MNISEKIKLSQNIAVISGIFCVIVSLLLLLNFSQVSKKDPLKNDSVKILVEKLTKDPKNEELIKDIRSLDLLARKAYFTNQWQVKTGSYLLLFGAIIFALALRFYYSLKARIEEPDKKAGNDITDRILAQKWVLITGACILILAFVSSFFSVDYLNRFSLSVTSGPDQSSSDSDNIEVITVGEVGQNDGQVKDSTMTPQAGEFAMDSVFSADVKNEGTVPIETEQVSAGKFPSADQMKMQYGAFRGSFGQGVSAFKNIPVKWDGSKGENILWKVKVPRLGFNSPVIWGNRLFISGSDNQVREIYCYDKNSGKLLWSKQLANVPGSPNTPPKVTSDTGLSAPSLTTDGLYVFVLFATGDIAGFDMNGNQVWAKNLGIPDNHYGHSSSLISFGDKLYVQYDTNRGSRLIALSKVNGEKVWETARNAKISWASPVLAQIGGSYQLILSADPIVAGYDAETGKELWTVTCLMGEVGPSPAYSDGLVYAGQEYAKFAAINPVSSSIVWESDEYLPEVASPVAANGLVFIATSYGVLACYDAKTGTKYWEDESGDGYYSSPVIAENKLYALDLQGNMIIFEVSKDKKLIAECPLGEKATTTPAFSDGKIFIRGDINLYCIGK